MQIEMNYGGPSMPMEYAQGELTQEKAIEAPINKSHKKKKIEAPIRGRTKEGEAINFKNNEGTSYSSM